MENWKTSLDRYLTNEPHNSSDDWYEAIDENLTEEFWEEHQDDFCQSEQYYTWADKLLEKTPTFDVDENMNMITIPGYMTAELAAKIIERAYKIYH